MTVTAVATIERVAPGFRFVICRPLLRTTQRLGFATREYVGGGYGFITRDNVEIHLGVVAAVDNTHAKHTCYLFVDDAAALAAEWKPAGIDVHMPVDTEWGQHEGRGRGPRRQRHPFRLTNEQHPSLIEAEARSPATSRPDRARCRACRPSAARALGR